MFFESCSGERERLNQTRRRQADEDQRKAKLSTESFILAQRARDRLAAEKRAEFLRFVGLINCCVWIQREARLPRHNDRSIRDETIEHLRAKEELRKREREDEERAKATTAAAALSAAREDQVRRQQTQNQHTIKFKSHSLLLPRHDLGAT